MGSRDLADNSIKSAYHFSCGQEPRFSFTRKVSVALLDADEHVLT